MCLSIPDLNQKDFCFIYAVNLFCFTFVHILFRYIARLDRQREYIYNHIYNVNPLQLPWNF